MLKVLVADRTPDDALAFLNCLALPGTVHITFVDNAVLACKNVKNRKYDLFLLGSRLERGQVYDVGLAIRNSKRNLRKPVVCLGVNVGRATKVANLLRPYSMVLASETPESVGIRLKRYLMEQGEVRHP